MEGTEAVSHKKKFRAQDVTLVAVDETSVSLQPERVRTFAPRGETPVLSSPARRTRLQAIVGITPEGELAYRTQSTSFTAAGCVAFLGHLLQRFSGEIIVVWDRLAAHRSRAVRQFVEQHDRLSLESLPAYAPDLNPEEWINKAVKREYKRNRLLRTLSELKKTVRDALESIRRRPARIISCFLSAGWF